MGVRIPPNSFVIANPGKHSQPQGVHKFLQLVSGWSLEPVWLKAASANLHNKINNNEALFFSLDNYFKLQTYGKFTMVKGKQQIHIYEEFTLFLNEIMIVVVGEADLV